MAKLKAWDDTGRTSLKVSQAIDLIAFGKIDKETWELIRFTAAQAWEELWLEKHNFYYHIRSNPALKAKYEDVKLSRRDVMNDKAEDNLMQAMDGDGDFAVMESKDRARLSLDILKQTERAYNPKIEIEAKTENMNFEVPMEELEKMILELIHE